jgi:hypothetical protein
MARAISQKGFSSVNSNHEITKLQNYELVLAGLLVFGALFRGGVPLERCVGDLLDRV